MIEGGSRWNRAGAPSWSRVYKEGTRVYAEALEGINDGELDAPPGPQAWTAREVVHHMADSEMTSAIRLRRLIAEDDPTIQGYDQRL